jgi:glycosyltransferase 2 family protein
VVFFAGRALFHRVEDVDWSLVRPGLPAVIPAVLLLLAAKLVSARVTQLSLRSFGRRLEFGKVLGARLASLPARYVPGRVAATGGLAVILTRYGVPGSEAVGAALIPTLLNLLVGLVLTLPLLLMPSGSGTSVLPGWPVLLPFAALLLVLLHPSILLRAVNMLLKRMRRSTLPAPSARLLFRSAVAIALMYGLSGGVLYLLALSLEPTSPALLPLVVFANAFSFIAGFVVFFVPAGLGIRESALLVLLGGSVPGIAIVAVFFRAVDVASDIVLGAAGALLVRRSLGGKPTRKPSDASAGPPVSGGDPLQQEESSG